MIRRILVAYDGSESADKAFRFALDLAKVMGAELHALGVARPPEFGADVETEAQLENTQEQYRKVMAHAVSRAHAEGITVPHSIVVGHPAEQIVLHAEEMGADMIVVGHRGRTLFERWLIGSIAKQVMAYAHCPVTVVR